MEEEERKHEGICCDGCDLPNFSGLRHKCLMCEEYDLCDDCFNNQLETKEHKTTHPTTLILNSSGRNDFTTGYECPYCEDAQSETAMYKHIVRYHPSQSDCIVSDCPICGKDLDESQFMNHLMVKHSMPKEIRKKQKKSSLYFGEINLSAFENNTNNILNQSQIRGKIMRGRGGRGFGASLMSSHPYPNISLSSYSNDLLKLSNNDFKFSNRSPRLRKNGLTKLSSSFSKDELKQNEEERQLKGKFIQDLLLSTLFQSPSPIDDKSPSSSNLLPSFHSLTSSVNKN